MEPDRHEVYERIPWETLERRSGDRQWLYVGLAGAVALGALAYSFMKSQPVESDPLAQPVPAAAPAATTPPAATTAETVASPVVMAEADLFAVDPERLIDIAVAHAEWLAVEYISVDGSQESRDTLTALLPSGIPLPDAPEGTQVFVDWAKAQRVTEIEPLTYQIDVLVRSLVSTMETGFVRQPPRVVQVRIGFDDAGLPRVETVPRVTLAILPTPADLLLQEVPPNLLAQVDSPESVIGGVVTPDGQWQIVAMIVGPDGVSRPIILDPS